MGCGGTTLVGQSSASELSQTHSDAHLGAPGLQSVCLGGGGGQYLKGQQGRLYAFRTCLLLKP